MTKDIVSNDIYIVAVDSRGHSPSDLECYKDQVCSRAFFREHIQDNPKNICVKSQVAGHCGLDLKIYFREHPKNHVRYSDEHKGMSPLGRTNGIATLLTFNPDTGYYNHIVRGKAYVLWNDGKTPLSKRQVWGIQEFIREAKEIYHKDGKQYSHEAKMHLLTSAYEYIQGTWVPHGIYEFRHVAPHRFTSANRSDSGLSDQATCHHGCTHAHHDGRHECCHCDPPADDEESDPVKNHHVISYSNDDDDEESESSVNRENDGAKHNRRINYKLYSKICH